MSPDQSDGTPFQTSIRCSNGWNQKQRAASRTTRAQVSNKIIAQMESDDRWLPLGEVGRQLANFASDFDPRNFLFGESYKA
ncbi:OST-HTH/LOTUS domain-containing protein [Nitrobacter hamburgensis]|uniref:OST-HTH/LOTUS domain-containing protein n=1 Tax=Nitrobacter hamburgensis TaxID=912 RepID=UPI0009D63DBF